MIPTPDDARRRHYGAFYSRPAVGADETVLLALGNCQAESLRLVVPASVATTVRIPPVHELTADDLPFLAAWLGRADAVVAQPIRDGYRGLPLGTRELLEQTRPGARHAVLPVIRFAGLYPRHLIIRPPEDPSANPPLVSYHDAGVLASAAGLRLTPLSVEAVRAVAAESIEALRLREERHGTVVASDLFAAPSFDLMRTINHPGNPVWVALGTRVLDRLGLPGSAADPGLPLLDSVHAPREAAVIEAFGLGDEPSASWTVEGRTVSAEEVRAAHLEWYAAHPGAVAAGLSRHASTLALLGLAS
ncbi:WcbI family polysaccharide biosynthesis putative acetyltransferase [Herbiconiux sp. CPCC 205716]|uniref:WcbI family polysaccharide biosynthesis putative acetyltransferase n=1 Tax=Herbiconiux gentiana TaxID=2970912 RepID=A0ABT2GIH1_9MICO|nr:WcbI family polysaccharide biosynthesis putative acetyltransferase [Herbiconiux gentiana]MCS5716024.1 WcbI family polysaccharide biosynthesis putative acetyltransferase [Herbiconiux gentiana]